MVVTMRTEPLLERFARNHGGFLTVVEILFVLILVLILAAGFLLVGTFWIILFVYTCLQLLYKMLRGNPAPITDPSRRTSVKNSSSSSTNTPHE